MTNQTWQAWWPDLYGTAENPTNYPGTHESYELAGKFLEGEGQVEEWGCATTYGRRYISSPYRGVDGAPSKWVDQVVDLSVYKSQTPKALMRHVLEHNWNWRVILNNFLDSFTDRAVLILFIEPGECDINRSFEHRVDEPPSPPGLQLDEESLLYALSRPGLAVVNDQRLDNDTPPFGYERIFYLRKDVDAEPYSLAVPACTACGRAGFSQIRSDYVVMGNRFEYAFNVCVACEPRILGSLYSLNLPKVTWV